MSARSRSWAVLALAVATQVAGAQSAPQQQDDVIARAMRDELARSMKELKLGALERPYFIAYTITDRRTLGATATGGSLLNSHDQRFRSLRVEVRVGDYAFDNSNSEDFGSAGGLIAIGGGGADDEIPSMGDLPLDDDYLAFRRAIWLATDAAYKQAIEQITAKRAGKLNRANTDTLADFSRETPTQTTDERSLAIGSKSTAESLARGLSGMNELRHLTTSTVRVGGMSERTWYVNSEGTSYLVSRPAAGVVVSGSTQSSDGRPVADIVDVATSALDSLPPRERLEGKVRDLVIRLDSLRAAPPMERYAGPVLFEGRAAGELFSEVFAPALVARRRAGLGPSLAAMSRVMRHGFESFTDRVGSRVLPEHLTVIDDPTLESWKGTPLLGTYKVDDQGVPGRRKTLIDAGIVASLLSTRTPVEGIAHSSGNDRDGGTSPSNVIVQSTNAVSGAELRKHLLEIVVRRKLKYGVIVRALGSAAALMDDMDALRATMMSGGGGDDVLLAYRLYPDGHEELVRDAQMADVTVASFKDIVAVSDSADVFQDTGMSSLARGLQMAFGSGMGSGASSYIVPSLLFEDVTFTKRTGELPALPLSPPPGSH